MTSDAWSTPSPAEGWTVADVVLDLAQTDELLRLSGFGPDGQAVLGLIRTFA